MPTNDFVPLATGVGANVQSQAVYLADPQLPIGQQPGVARSAFNNKALRQATYIASCVAQFLANVTGNNVLDDGTQAEVLATMAVAFKSAPVVEVFTASGLYTVPANALYLRVRAVGGGGGAAGTGSASGGTGGTGGNTTFGIALITASGGSGGVYNTNGGAGGAASLGAASGIALTGAAGQGASNGIAGADQSGGQGGSSPFGGAGAGAFNTAVGGSAVANTGSGGGGGGANPAAGGGAGGGAGGFVDALITGALSATYNVVIGAGGTAGTAGGSGVAGGAGGSGLVEVTAYFQ